MKMSAPSEIPSSGEGVSEVSKRRPRRRFTSTSSYVVGRKLTKELERRPGDPSTPHTPLWRGSPKGLSRKMHRPDSSCGSRRARFPVPGTLLRRLGVRPDCQHACAIEPDRESSTVQIYVWASGEKEGKIEEPVESSFHESVCVQIHDRPEGGRRWIQSPNPQFRVRVQKPPENALTTTWRRYVLHREELPSSGERS